MAEKKELTDKEKETLAKKEEGRKVALKNIESGLWNYALPTFMTFENYGRFSESAKEKYAQEISKPPSQEVWEQIFAPQYKNEVGMGGSAYVQKSCAAIIQSSFALLKVEDIMKYTGIKGNIKESYKDKFLSDLDKKEAEEIMETGFQYGLNKKIIEIVGDEQKGINSGLEKLICEEPKKEEKKK